MLSVTSGMPHRPPANFLADVADESNRRAEDLVYEYLNSERGWDVIDARGQCGHWDFEVRRTHEKRMLTLDVKADNYIDATVRVAFEDRHEFDDGRVKDGWGRYTDLDLVAVVGTQTWLCYFVRLRTFRALIGRWTKEVDMPRGVVSFRRVNRSGYTTVGWAVPLEELLRANAIYHVAQVPDGGM
jgi:hypothetical protein